MKKIISYVYGEKPYLTHEDWKRVNEDIVDAIAKVVKVYSLWGKKIDAFFWFDYLKRLQTGDIKPGHSKIVIIPEYPEGLRKRQRRL